MTPLIHISGEAHVAAVYGFEEAVFLDSIIFWYRTNKANNHNFRDGCWWTYNSIKAFEEIFPWWSAKQIRRIAGSCRDKGAVIAGTYNEDRRDRSLWYTPSNELLALYKEEPQPGICICPDGQMDAPEQADELAQKGECNIRKPCSNHGETDMEDPPYGPPEGDGAVPDSPEPEDKPKPRKRRSRKKASVPTHAPERFEKFWQLYPVGGSRLKAVEAWDALAPDDELIDEMARALKRQMATRAWKEGIGIPHACRWISNQRWTDKLPEEPKPCGTSSGWSDFPGKGAAP